MLDGGMLAVKTARCQYQESQTAFRHSAENVKGGVWAT